MRNQVVEPAGVREPRPAVYESEGVEVPTRRPMVRGGLLLYHFPSAHWFRDAATIMDHVTAFERYSRFGIRTLNTDTKFPRRIAELDFQLIIVHYSVVAASVYYLTEDHLEWLRTSRGYKVVLPQDENRYCGHRFWFCDEVGFDAIYTLLEPDYFDRVYGSRTRVPKIRHTLPGYVSEQMVLNARRLGKPHEQRPTDVGYRGRALAVYSGRGGLEKQEIGRGFAKRARGLGLELDIRVEEEDRLYGGDWPSFLSRCKAVLGVESGVSVFDVDDRVVDQYERLSAAGREVTVDDLTEALPLENQIPYRTISPRHFEASAMRTCQILFEGRYSGVLEPMRHYIPLRKDFSNFDEVIRLFRDERVRAELVENARRELVDSGRYSYRTFIEEFDRDLIDAGLDPARPRRDTWMAWHAVNRGRWWRKLAARLRWAYYRHLAPDPWAVLRYKLISRPVAAIRRFRYALVGRAARAVRRLLPAKRD